MNRCHLESYLMASSFKSLLHTRPFAEILF